MSAYTVIYERDKSGWWVANVEGIPGCHTQGKSIEQARRRIREALNLFVRGAKRAQLIDDIRLPSSAISLLDHVEETRKRLESDQAELQKSTAIAAKTLTRTMHMSLRDAGLVLGLSYQRVQQLIGKPSTARNSARHSRPAKRIKSAHG
jgi:predicted RNase H-like HicB family nuclease